MVTESLVGRVGSREGFTARTKPISEPAGERLSVAIARFIEYPSSSNRHASSPNNWRLPDWVDYQVQKMITRRKT